MFRVHESDLSVSVERGNAVHRGSMLSETELPEWDRALFFTSCSIRPWTSFSNNLDATEVRAIERHPLPPGFWRVKSLVYNHKQGKDD